MPEPWMKIGGLMANKPPRKVETLAFVEGRDSPQDGDLRSVRETKRVPHRFRVDWYGTVQSNIHNRKYNGVPITGWRVAANYGDEGYFDSYEDAREAINGPSVVIYFRPVAEAAAPERDDNVDDGSWRLWDGVGCPCSADLKVDYKLRNGTIYASGREARELLWSHTWGSADIVAWRPHQ